ncbi:unnamed protein product, partial [Dicrocoelium dendriticum]
MAHGINDAHEATATIWSNRFRAKEQPSRKETSGVIYKIFCKNGEKDYVGQTGRKLGTRLHEHSLAIRRQDERSLMSVHMDAEGHQFDLGNAKILGRAKNRRVHRDLAFGPELNQQASRTRRGLRSSAGEVTNKYQMDR